MNVFVELLIKFIPIYVLIFLGYIAGRFLGVRKESVAPLLIYVIVPIVVFTGVVTTKLSLGTLSIPFIFFIIACSLSLFIYYFSGLFWRDSTRNILAYMAGSANAGYFGLPVVVAIFGDNSIGIVALAVLGLSLYSSTLGFFLTARGRHTAKESLVKVLKLPLVYAFFLAVLINISGLKLSDVYFDTARNFTGAFMVLGMMLIGLGLSDIKEYKFDLKFIGVSLIAKFFLWPFVMLLIIIVDNLFFRLYSPELNRIFMILSIVPVAANTISFATVLNVQPEKASLAVLISTLFALFYIPLVTIYFLILI